MQPPAILGVNQFTTKPQSFEDDLALYERLGVELIEVCEQKLSDNLAEARDKLALLPQHGLTISSVQPRVHALFPDRMAAEPTEPTERLACFRRAIELFTDAFPGLDVPFVTIGGAAANYDFRHAHETARRLYPPLADIAADRGARIAFEPIHPYLLNADTFVYALDDALRLIDDVDRPNFGLVFDIWHLWQEPDLLERIESISERIFVVHLSDWPPRGPRRLDDRMILGEGVIDVAEIFAALERGGYGGPYCLEILSDKSLPDSLWKADPVEVIERSRAGFERAWGQLEQV
jgi:sugar phosphate isomerase/epimerase